MDFANSKKFKTKILQERPEALRCGPVMRLLILAYCLLSLSYGVLVNRLLISSKRPPMPELLGRKFLPHLGQSTGAEKTVALSSMSGDVKECPQCGQVVLMNSLNISDKVLFVVLTMQRKRKVSIL